MDAPVGVTQEEGRTGFPHLPSVVLALILSREGFSPPFPSSTVKYIEFCEPTPLVGHVFVFVFFVRKHPSSCDCTEI